MPGMGMAAASAMQETSRIDFSIPAQPLATALIAFGKQANVQVLTAGCTIARFRSLGAIGNLSAPAALSKLLEGTGLVYEFTDQGTVVVTLPQPPGQAGSAKPRPEARQLTAVEANALAARDIGFKASLTSAGSRNDADLIDVPQSVSVVTRELMDSQQSLTVEDAVRNVAGVAFVEGSDGLPLFQIRGFYTGNGLIDGMPNSNAGSGDFPPLIGLERVEVIKGPQSILGDSTGNSFGGLVNVTTKQPQSEPVHEVSYTLGQQGMVQAGLDMAGPLGHVSGLTYRLVMSGDYADRTPQGYRNRRSGYLAPSIGWSSPSTQLVVGAQRILNRLPMPDHAVLLGDTMSTATPFGLLTGNEYDYANYQTNRLYYLLDQQLGNAWTWRSRGQYVEQENDLQSWTLTNPTLLGDVSPYAQAYRYSDTYYSLQNDFIRVFGTGPVTHTVTLGMDYSRSRVGHTDDFWHSYNSGVYNLFSDAALPRVSEVVQPEDLGNWNLPHNRVDELTAARAKLVGLLDAGARDRVPEAAARAQARFDCWVEQQEENHQPDHISACRDQFFAALAEVQQAAPAPAQPAAVQPETYVAYFDWNKFTLKPEATQVIDKAIAAAKAGGTPSISVTGHADRSGPEDYNLKLSLKRADAVREYLIKHGITAEQITVSGRGEAEPAVPTADGVKEPRNRRVEIIVQ